MSSENNLFVTNFAKKRGRKPINKYLHKYRELYPKLSNARLLEKYYCNLFLNCIIKDNELLEKYKTLSFLIFPKIKKTILTELGRVLYNYSLSRALGLANHICNETLNTSKAINYIRNSRKLGKNRVNGTIAKLLKILDNACLTKKEKKKVLSLFIDYANM